MELEEPGELGEPGKLVESWEPAEPVEPGEPEESGETRENIRNHYSKCMLNNVTLVNYDFLHEGSYS